MTPLDSPSMLLTQLQQLFYEHQFNPEPPSNQQLQSALPFCYDSMHFEQWLEFVFLPRMQHLLAANNPVPAMALTPILELRVQQRPELTILAPVLRQLDELSAC